MDLAQLAQMKSGKGFIAALDQSGGSTPKALSLYGIEADAYSGDEAMFDLVHQMRTRIIKSSAFTSERVIGVILFEMTMDRMIDGMGSAEYLWQKKKVVPFLKVDNGLADEKDGAQVMKPIPELDKRLISALSHGVFGTKMRSVIKQANLAGVTAVVENNQIIGIITDGDIRRMLNANDSFTHLTAQDIMTKNPKNISSDILVSEALSILENNSITQLMVIDNNEYKGVLHLHDILKEGIV